MWELVRLADGKWSVRLEGEEKWILPQDATGDVNRRARTPIANPDPTANRPRVEPWVAIEIQRMLNNLGV